MSAYMLLCNFTDQGIQTIKEVPKRRAAAQELGKKFGVDIKAGYLALGADDLIVHAESASDDAMAKFLLSLASKGDVRLTTVKVFSQEESDKIIDAVAYPGKTGEEAREILRLAFSNVASPRDRPAFGNSPINGQSHAEAFSDGEPDRPSAE